MGKYYNHVGRPTNEEVIAQKKKKTLKILIPLLLIVILMLGVVGRNRLKGLMGAEIGGCQMDCSDGWILDGDVCYQETVDEYVLGDTDNDKVVTLKDYETIKNSINDNEALSYVEKIIYDINGDGEITEEDITDNNSSSTVDLANNDNQTLCPKDKKVTMDVDGEDSEISISYKALEDNTTCMVSISLREEQEPEKTCYGKIMVGTGASPNGSKKIQSKAPSGYNTFALNLSVIGKGTLKVQAWNKKLCKKAEKGNKRVQQKKEPCANKAVLYWANKKILNSSDFVYPKDKKTGLPLGAWPKNYKKYYTQLYNTKTYHKYYIWPITPLNGTYSSNYYHVGMDINAKFGTPVYSPVDGTLIYSDWALPDHVVNRGSDETSYTITIKPNKIIKYNGVNINRVYLTHLAGIRYRCIDGKCSRKVKQGELLGFSGTASGTNKTSTTGWAPHLHLTLYNSSNYSDGLKTSNLEKFYNIKNKAKRKVGE